MGISIGKFHVGYRSNDPQLWKKYRFPKYYISPPYKHEYFKFYIRWLNFFFTMPRKCECCGEFKKGNEWGAYKSNYDNRVCYSCLIKMKECSICSELKKQKEFDFDYKTKTFNDKCKKCNEIESNL